MRVLLARQKVAMEGDWGRTASERCGNQCWRPLYKFMRGTGALVRAETLKPTISTLIPRRTFP